MPAGLQRVVDGIWRWEAYSPEHKVDLTSHAVLADGVLFLFDPIELDTSCVSQLLAHGPVRAILLTNENHERAAAWWHDRTAAPILRGAEIGPPWEVFDLAGGAPGECAFRCRARDLVVFGDAVVNLPGRGLEILPAKYCTDQSALRARLNEITVTPFGIALLAHGSDLAHGASAAIRAMLRG